jgi:YidC/Oxa1 family membrane protein insertase
MDRRTILAVVLSLAIYYAWLAFRAPPHPKTPDGATPDGQPSPAAPAPASPAPAAPAPVAALPPPPEDTVTVPFAACGVTGKVSTDGGRISALTVDGSEGPYQVQPLWKHLIGVVTFKESLLEWKPYGEPPGPEVLLSDKAGGLVAGAGPLDQVLPMAIVANAPGRLELEGRTADGVVVHKTFAERKVDGDHCAIDATVTFRNEGAAPFTGETWVSIRDHVPPATGRYDSKPEPEALVDGSLWYGGVNGAGCLGGWVTRRSQLTDASGPYEAPGPVAWFAMANRYFGFFAVPQQGTTGNLRLVRLGAGDEAVDGPVFGTTEPLSVGAERKMAFSVYAGPKVARALEAVDPSLSRSIDLGFWAFFGYPLLWLLRRFHDVVGNWGVAIILLTVLVKAVTFPLTQRAFKATQKMQQIQPELTRIKEEYKDDPAEMQRRTMALMSEAGANPLSGCGPMFLQTPIWIALSTVILSSVDLYHRGFLYLKDLASPDPYMILPIAITALMWGQQQLTPVNTAMMDETQRQTQQTMKYMPLVMGLLFFAFPSGLAVYVFVNTLLSIVQQWWIRRGSGTGAAPVAVAAGS